VGVLSGMGWKVLGWELRGRVAEEGAAVLPEVVGVLDEWVTGSETAAAAAAAAAVAATPAKVAASWVAVEAAVGMAGMGLEGGLVDVEAGMAGSVGAAVGGSMATWGASRMASRYRK